MKKRSLPYQFKDKVWWVWLAALFVVLFLWQNRYLGRLKTYNSFLRDLEMVERAFPGSKREQAQLFAYEQYYGVTAASVREFVEEQVPVLMREMKREAVEQLTLPMMMMLPLVVVPCAMTGRRRYCNGIQAMQRPVRFTVALVLETFTVVLILNGATSLLAVWKWMFHSRAETFTAVPTADWLQLRPVLYCCLFVVPSVYARAVQERLRRRL